MANEGREFFNVPNSELEPIRQFLLSSITGHTKSQNPSENYQTLGRTLLKKDDVDMLWKVYIGLCSCVSTFTHKPDLFRDLIQSIYSYSWNLESKVTMAFLRLLKSMVSANVTFLTPTLQSLVSSFIPHHASTQQELLTEDFVFRTRQVHETMKAIIAIVPTGQSELFDILADNFPHKRFSQLVHTQYVAQLLNICEYVPSGQQKILDLIVCKCLEIDVEIVIEDSGEVKIVEVYDGEIPGDDMFQLDDFNMTTNSNTQLTQPPQRPIGEDLHRIPIAVSEMADKLDAMLVLVVDFIDSQFVSLHEDLLDKLFDNLLVAFEDKILATHKSKFVQFLMFYTSSRTDRFANAYLRWLLRIFLDGNNHAAIKKQSAIMYIASYVSRANFLTIEIIQETISNLLNWANNYVSRTSAPSSGARVITSTYGNKEVPVSPKLFATTSFQSTPYDPDRDDFDGKSSISRHETFYSCVQAICYMLCFHGVELANIQKNSPELRQQWQNIMTCEHQPLKYCLQSVRLEFLRLVQHVGLFREECWSSLIPELLSQKEDLNNYTNSKIIRNPLNDKWKFNTKLSTSAVKMGSGANPLDSFFPYDPCLLSRLYNIIEKSYRMWRGVPGLDMSSDDTEIDVDLGTLVGKNIMTGIDDDDADSAMSSSISSIVSSLAHTYGTDIMASASFGNSIPVESIMRAVVVANKSHSSVSGSEAPSFSSWEDEMGDGMSTSAPNEEDGTNLAHFPLPFRRPRVSSIGSDGYW